MESNLDKRGASINTLFNVLYQTLQGKKVPYNDVVQKARQLYPIILPELIASLDHNAIVKEVVDRYVSEVGIKTFDPEFIDLDKESKYWLYREKERMPRHPFFDRYKLYLSNDGFEPKVIENIESSCEQILARCANPKTTAPTERKKGLVVGDVQSGKTANYLGLINMAYDYGYRIVVLLAGTTNSLREQTQKRTDSGVIGAKSDSIGNSIEFLGVGLNTNEHFAVPFTNRVNDFTKFVQKNLNVAIADINKPVVLVVKKVKSVLESVAERLQSELSEKGLDCRSILIIDDEADNASITTSKDPDKPTAINRCIRDIFNKFPIASYVGYTATPFANIFINPYDNEDYLDLFPTDFIAQLHAPSTYFGGRLVFPKDKHSRYVRLISENEQDFLPVVHDKYVPYPALADSLKEAINTFIICNVIRTLRGQGTKHRSMMINITRYNDTQARIWERVNEYLETVKNAIEQLSDMSVDEFCRNRYCNALYKLYHEDDFFKDIREGNPDANSDPIAWELIQRGLYDECKKIIVVVINSRNGQMDNIDPSGQKKRFDYDDRIDEGARVIAIGGLVLSRGLTLEGLMTSYYSRNAGAYDTLLQMCRWFGYRPKYMDLCRIYLTQVSIDQFDAVLTATEDLKSQFNEMKLRDKKPIDFGIMIQECPDTLETTLLITSRNKMRGTQVFSRRLNYSGVYADTSKMYKDPAKNRHNLDAFADFCKNVKFGWIGKGGSDEHRYYMSQMVSQHYIAKLFRDIVIPIENKKFNATGLAEYIEENDKYPYWDVVIAKGDDKNLPKFLEVYPVQRSFHMRSENDFIRIGGSNNRVLDPGLLNAGLWYRVGETLSAKEYCNQRKVPILVIFPIDLKCEFDDKQSDVEAQEQELRWRKETKKNLGGDVLLAFAYGFPGTDSKLMVNYRANKVMIDQLTAGIELDDEDEGVDDADD